MFSANTISGYIVKSLIIAIVLVFTVLAVSGIIYITSERSTHYWLFYLSWFHSSILLTALVISALICAWVITTSVLHFYAQKFSASFLSNLSSVLIGINGAMLFLVGIINQLVENF